MVHIDQQLNCTTVLSRGLSEGVHVLYTEQGLLQLRTDITAQISVQVLMQPLRTGICRPCAGGRACTDAFCAVVISSRYKQS